MPRFDEQGVIEQHFR